MIIKYLVLITNLLSILKAETVHFTNSPNKILRANNFTTYKVNVPNGDSITIIEANTPLINKNIKFNEVENAEHLINHNRNNNVMDLKTSLSMTVTPHNNHDFENLPATEEESVTNDYGNLSPEHSDFHHEDGMKTVYSPELLEKFLKDYASKVQTSEPLLTSSKPPIQFDDPHNNFEDYKDKYTDKYTSIEAEEDDGNRRVSSIDDDKELEAATDVQERKHYRPGNNVQHPYNKNSGWVTLEAIPWSKSKVSKWQSSVKPSYANHNNNNNQNNNYNNNNGYNRPPRPPPYNYPEEDYNNNSNDEDYYHQKPTRPTYQNNQFYERPSQNRPDSSYAHHSTLSSHHSSSFNSNNNYDNDHRPNRPYQPEIITDNRPANFPPHHEHAMEHENRPSSYDNRPSRPNNDYNSHYSNKDSHPLSYPNSGSGDWVLVSTTKGQFYLIPIYLFMFTPKFFILRLSISKTERTTSDVVPSAKWGRWG